MACNNLARWLARQRASSGHLNAPAVDESANVEQWQQIALVVNMPRPLCHEGQYI
jgi:hypothetical protein